MFKIMKACFSQSSYTAGANNIFVKQAIKDTSMKAVIRRIQPAVQKDLKN